MFFAGNDSLFDKLPASGMAQCFWDMRCSSSSSKSEENQSASVIQLKSGRIYTILRGGTPVVASYRGKSFLFMNSRVQSTVFGGYDVLTAVHVTNEKPLFWMQICKDKSNSFDNNVFSGWHPTPAEAMRSLFDQVGHEFARLDKGDAAKAYGITLLEYTSAIERDPEYTTAIAELKQKYKGTIENVANYAPRGGRPAAAGTKNPTNNNNAEVVKLLTACCNKLHDQSATTKCCEMEQAQRRNPRRGATMTTALTVAATPAKTHPEPQSTPRAEMAFVKRQRMATMTNHERHTAYKDDYTNANITAEIGLTSPMSAASMNIIAEAASYKLFEEDAKSRSAKPITLQTWRQSRKLADGALSDHEVVTPSMGLLKTFITTLVAMDSRLLELPDFQNSLLAACEMMRLRQSEVAGIVEGNVMKT